ncbi:hypothetical protein WN944_007362 [Citrus x changshan-huyou]|uniref:Uncharacterized protein n=1 Tax=Citrus x changshan-huyou TaxID=2935761 RepID=A0AAP0QXZ8_9ROSI
METTLAKPMRIAYLNVLVSHMENPSAWMDFAAAGMSHQNGSLMKIHDYYFRIK